MPDQTVLDTPLELRPEVLPHKPRFPVRRLSDSSASTPGGQSGQPGAFGEFARISATLAKHNVELTPTGLIYHGDRNGAAIPLEAELEIGAALFTVDRQLDTMMRFAIGGWLNHAVKGCTISGRIAEFEKRVPVDSYHAARKYSIVERRIPRDLRLPALPWTLYEELATLDVEQQRFWITKAIERPGSVSVNRVRIHKKLQKAEAEKQKLVGKDEDDYSRFVVDGAAELPKTGPAPERIPASRVEVLPGLEAEPQQSEQDEQPSEESSTGGEAFDDLARIVAVIERWWDRLEQMALQHYGEAFGQTRDTADFLELMVAAQWDKMRK